MNFENDDVDDITEFNEDDLNDDGSKLSKKKRQRLKKKEKLDKKKKDKLLKNKNYGIFEDVIDGQGVRFKYRKTESANYGLTDEEILLADEKELNRWISLRKSQQYEDDKQDIEKFNRKGKNLRLKRKIFKSLYASSEDEDQKHQDRHHTNPDDSNHSDEEQPDTVERNVDDIEHKDGQDDEPLSSDDLLNKKRKKKNRKRKKNKKQKLIEQES